MKKVHFRRDLLLIFLMILLSSALWLLPQPPKLARQSGTPVRATVKRTDDRALMKLGLLEYGTQNLTVQIASGQYAGAEFPAANELRAQMELDKKFQPGDAVFVILPETVAPGPRPTLTAKDHDRSLPLWILAALFSALLILFGSWTGVKALFSFLLSCLILWKAVIPLVLSGWPAAWTIFLCVILLTAAIQFLVAGINQKGTAAFLGAAAGVFSGLVLGKLFTFLLKINGAVLPYSQALCFSGYETLDLQDLFSGAMILACSGAVMDLAMDIASGMEEVAVHAPGLPRKLLICSGFRIGRSVVGTMTTTLLLAYSGGFITLLMMFYTQGNTLGEILNNPLVASEVVKTFIGSFSLILVAPFTAIFAGYLYRREK